MFWLKLRVKRRETKANVLDVKNEVPYGRTLKKHYNAVFLENDIGTIFFLLVYINPDYKPQLFSENEENDKTNIAKNNKSKSV